MEMGNFSFAEWDSAWLLRQETREGPVAESGLRGLIAALGVCQQSVSAFSQVARLEREKGTHTDRRRRRDKTKRIAGALLRQKERGARDESWKAWLPHAKQSGLAEMTSLQQKNGLLTDKIARPWCYCGRRF